MSDRTSGVDAIAKERSRQLQELGYTAEHDRHHSVRDFVGAAMILMGGRPAVRPSFIVTRVPPGTDQRRDLIRAGALIAAAIDRLDEVDGEREWTND